MILVDSCVLLDILLGQREAQRSAATLNRLQEQGTSLFINHVIYAELAVFFKRQGRSRTQLDDFLRLTGLQVRPTGCAPCWQAAELAVRSGRKRCDRILPDFLIAADAIAIGTLLTRDRGFAPFRRFGLRLLQPSSMQQ